MIKKLSNIGDCGVVCDFGDEVNQKINAGVIQLFHYIKEEVSKGKIEGILNYKFLCDKHRNIGFLKCQRCKM